MGELKIHHGLCRVCDACVAVCPTGALWVEGEALRFDSKRCEECRHCLVLCPAGALQAPAPATSRDA